MTAGLSGWIPAEAGMTGKPERRWIPASAGMTGKQESFISSVTT
jgi:hypothetical protein